MLTIIRSPKALGASLRRHRRSLGLTQAQVSAKAGIRQGTVSQIENGLETVKLRTVMDLLRALDLELALQQRSKGSHRDIGDLF